MAQHPKEAVDRRIRSAALQVFADHAFEAASMAEIARTAEISTGNIYHYYKSKQDLFEAVVPASLAMTIADLVEQRVASLSGSYDVQAFPKDAPFFGVSETLLKLCISHRLETVILLTRGAGTRYDTFRADVEQMIIRRALGQTENPLGTEAGHLELCLEMIYRNFIDNLSMVLHRFEKAADIMPAIKKIERYHLAGMRALFMDRSEIG